MATKKASGKKRAVQVDLIPDRGIPVLDKLAQEYAEIRDERMALTTRETDLQTALLAEMHKHNKTEYKHGSVKAWVVPSEEKVKVKVKPDEVEITEE